MPLTSSQMSSEQSSTKKKKARRKAFPVNPAKVMVASVYSGLAALVRLAEKRVTRNPEVIRLVNELKFMWDEAREKYENDMKNGVLDFSYIINIEHNMRKKFLDILWLTTKPYGNTEEKRVYKWSQGTIGTLNQLLNYAGAMLRSIAMKYYPFPKVRYYQLRKFADGFERILPKSVAKKYPPRKNTKTYWVAVYPGNSKVPLYRIRHSTLPEMDFVDMIRAHVIELVRQCFIYNVPRKASQRYIRFLIYRLQPFLDWVYTGCAKGRSRFWPEADQELRDIVLELRSIYGRRTGYTPRLTHQIEVDTSYKHTQLDLVQQFQSALKNDTSIEMQNMLWDSLKLMGYSIDDKNPSLLTVPLYSSDELKKRVLKLLKRMNRISTFNKSNTFTVKETSVNVYLTDDDVKELHDRMQHMSQKEGNDWHRILFGDMFHPSSLHQVIFAGDNFLDDVTDIMIAAEVPIITPYGSGKADLVVFIRRIIASKAIWTPIMILDVKTKMGINWSLQGKKPRTKKKDSRILSFDVWKRTLTQSEWTSIINCTPTTSELQQLDRYEQGLISEYADLMKKDPDAPKHLWKGIVVLDPDEDKENIFFLLPELIRALISEIKDGLEAPDSRMFFRPHLKGVSKKSQHKVGVVLVPSKGPQQLLEKTTSLEEVIDDDPFEKYDKEQRIKINLHFTLYLTVASADSSGESAGWIARNWHLLHHLNELRKYPNGLKNIVWFDLTGELADPLLREQRFRFIGDQRTRRVSRRTMDSLRELVKSIDFQDLSEEVMQYFFNDAKSALNDMELLVKERVQELGDEQNIIVIDGWPLIRQMVPSHLDKLSRVLESRLLEWLPNKEIEVIWLDNPVPLPIVSATYQLHRFTALPYNSPRRYLIDEVIWNVPSSPRNLGWRAPRREDIRLITYDLPTKSDARVIPLGVPHLRGWAKRFRADSKKERKVTEEEATDADVKMYGKGFAGSSNYVIIGEQSEKVILDDIYQLIPSLCRIRDKEKSDENQTMDAPSPKYEFKPKGLDEIKKSKGLWGRTSVVSAPQMPRRGRPGVYSSISHVTRGKVRKTIPEPKVISRTSRRPPVVKPTSIEEVDTEQIQHQEVLRILKTAEFLIDKFHPNSESKWHGVLKSTIEICGRYQDEQLTSLKALERLRVLYEKREVSMDIWKDLLSERGLFGGIQKLSPNVYDIIRERPELMTLYGNALFLLVHSVINKSESEFDIKDGRIFAKTLWSAASDWQWAHMGFTLQTLSHSLVQHRFDPSALWSNLCWRVRQVSTSPMQARFLENIRYGKRIPLDQNKMWIIFQENSLSNKMVAGLLRGMSKRDELKGTYNTVIAIPSLVEYAEQALENQTEEESSIAITRFEDIDLIWTRTQDDDEWSLLGRFKYLSQKNRRLVPIRRFSFDKVPSKEIRQIPELSGLTVPDDLDKRVDDVLRGVMDEVGAFVPVIVEVSLDEDKERYLVHLLCDISGDVIESQEFEKTEDVIGFLSIPLSSRMYYKSKEGVHYSWDAKGAITYTGVETSRGQVDLSFLTPLVHDGSFLDGKYSVPKTAKAVLETEMGSDLLLMVEPDLERYRKDWDQCWKIWVVNIEIGEKLKALENEFMRIEDMVLFFECGQLVDVDAGLRHAVNIVMDKVDAVRVSTDGY